MPERATRAPRTEPVLPQSSPDVEQTQAQLLIVDDDPHDAAVTLHTLRRDGLDVHADIVATCGTLAERLAARPYDLVIADNALADGTARDVLRIVRRHRPGTPCIVFSGTLTDAVAAHLVRAGAADYVLKGAPARLAVAVRQALARLAERTRAADEMHDSDERFGRAFDEAPLGMSLVTRDLRYIQVNMSLCRMLGYSRTELLPLGVAGVVHPDDVAEDIDLMGHAFRGDTPRCQRDERYRTKTGAMIWVSLTASVLRDRRGAARYGLRMVVDITARKRSEEELSAMSRRVLQVQEAERRRLAQALHDDAGQLLTGLQLMLESGDRRSADMLAIVRDLQHRIRTISATLRPPLLDELGLAAALEEHCRRIRDTTGMLVTLTQHATNRRFPVDTETAAFRIVQEGLTNVLRHAGVKNADVSVVADATTLRVEVRDRGTGFDPPAAMNKGSTGLAGMCERVRLIGGQCQIDSTPGAGTRIVAELPASVPV